MKLVEQHMDLFTVPKEYSFAHCISADCALGAGIAEEFRHKYPDLGSELDAYKIMNYIRIGETLSYGVTKENRWIFNMVTKDRFWEKPTYNTMQMALESLKKNCIDLHIDRLAIPRIGCGLDKLAWSRVKPMIEATFVHLDIEILVCYI